MRSYPTCYKMFPKRFDLHIMYTIWFFIDLFSFYFLLISISNGKQLEESTIRQRLGGRRDSAAQISAASPPSTSPPASQRRRRSSLAQLTDILREWSGGGSKRQKAPLNRRETLADLARSLPWGRNTIADTDNSTQNNQGHVSLRKRRESSADSGIKSMRSRRESHTSDFNKTWQKKESPNDRDKENTDTGASTDNTRSGSRRGSGESSRSRRDSTINRALTPPPPKVVGTRKRRDSLTVVEMPNFRQEQRPSTSSTASDSGPYFVNSSDMGCQALPPPTMVISSVTPPATSPTAPSSGRRDSTTQCGRVNRRDSRASPERPRLQRLQRQATAFDESCPPLGNRRESQPALSPTSGPADGEDGERRARRDSLSPDSASRGRRDSRQHLSPDRNRNRDGSPRRSKVRRQSSSAGQNPRSPESSSCCSSRYLQVYSHDFHFFSYFSS